MSRVEGCMKEICQNYLNCRKSESLHNFWDIVVITTFDEAQKLSFQKIIDELLDESPCIKAKVQVIADPPKQKLGSGGSTLHVLQLLFQQFGSNLLGKRVFIIHSGGFSQRLPSYSIQGKVFSPVPIKSFLDHAQVCHMIELKLALYLPFCNALPPGVFVTCGDDIETFYFDPNSLDCDNLKHADVVALAHPCDLQTATGHGVYVLPDVSANHDAVVVSKCFEVLQKPSVALMKEKNAIIKDAQTGEEKVYSDSVFWLSERAYISLLSWYSKTCLRSELDAYAHFLPCLGSNVQKFTDKMVGHKAELFPILKDMDFKVIVLKESKFYHLGTMNEYLYLFTSCESFRRELDIVCNTSNVRQPFKSGQKDNAIKSGQVEDTAMKSGQKGDSAMIASCYLQCDMLIDLRANARFIAEWCTIGVPIYVTENLILSNCKLQKCPGVTFLHEPVSFLGSFLYHTIPVNVSGKLMYVTVAFEIDSCLKQRFEDVKDIRIASVPLNVIIEKCQLDEGILQSGKETVSLWTLKLFEASHSAERSFWQTHNFVQRILHCRDGTPVQTDFSVNVTERLFSMEEVVNRKDLETFMSDRRSLLKCIDSNHLNSGH